MLDRSPWKGYLYLPVEKVQLRMKPAKLTAIPYYA